MPLSLSEKALCVKPSSTLAITAKAKAMRAEGLDVVSFAAGEPNFNTPENICEAAIQAIRDGFTRYTPASGIIELREAVSAKFKMYNNLDYTAGQIVISNGGKHSLSNIFGVLLNPGDEVIIPVPYWLTYPELVRLSGGVPVYVHGKKEIGYKVTASSISDAVSSKTKAVIINTPNNPTGMVYTKEELAEIAKVAIEKNFYIVSDEMYEQLTYGGHAHVSIASLGDEIYKRTITCSGLSKSYAMTGWRIGYTGSSVEIARLMGGIQSHQTSNPCSVAQKAALEALTGDQSTVVKMKEAFAERKKYIYERVTAMPYVEALEPAGAFYVLLDFTKVLQKSHQGQKIESANQVAQILIEDFQVAVIPCEDFGFPHFIRLSYAISMKAIDKGIGRIESFLQKIEQ
ncbi:MAG: pyridoxal phosphate-dependent aminotransferase [Lachnospiraceae bacterium]|nr:pyridoxal phosphate-dependent aminotransferase [Lachnospiraceae bacterium]